MVREGVFRRRSLPHWDVDHRPIFVTARLYGTLPATSWRQVEAFRAELARRAEQLNLSRSEREHWRAKRLFLFIDSILDSVTPATPLTDPRIAPRIESSLRHVAGERYELLNYTLMPSHLHWLFRPLDAWVQRAVNHSRLSGRPRTPREIIVHSFQSYTALQCNRALGRTGHFWQSETFDHWVRDELELARIMNYIEQNPVRAGLVAKAKDWPWSLRTT